MRIPDPIRFQAGLTSQVGIPANLAKFVTEQLSAATGSQVVVKIPPKYAQFAEPIQRFLGDLFDRTLNPDYPEIQARTHLDDFRALAQRGAGLYEVADLAAEYQVGDSYFFITGAELPSLPDGLVWEGGADRHPLSDGLLAFEYVVKKAEALVSKPLELKLGTEFTPQGQQPLPEAPVGMHWEALPMDNHTSQKYVLKVGMAKPRTFTPSAQEPHPPPARAGFRWERSEVDLGYNGVSISYREVPLNG